MSKIEDREEKDHDNLLSNSRKLNHSDDDDDQFQHDN